MSFSYFNAFVGGAICMGELVIAMAFTCHWRRLRDRLFLWFAAAFLLLAFERLLLLLWRSAGDHTPVIYVTRLVAYLLIIFAVVDRNRRHV
jgi:hypothetical protein